MALKRRKNSPYWWTDFTTPGGQRIRRSTGTANKQEAQEYHDELKVSFWRVQKLGEKPRRLWQEAAVKWLKVKKDKKDLEKDRAKLVWFDQYLNGVYLDTIDRALVEKIADAKEDEDVTGSTVNRYLALLRSILRIAQNEWEWITHSPAMPMRKETKGRVRWLTRTETERLMDALPKHYEYPARFTLAAGPRQANVLGLCWDQVDMDKCIAWLHPDETKNGEGIAIALNNDAMNVLKACKGKHEHYVFTKDGKPMKGIESRPWKQALTTAKIENFRWHDLRHTWASWHMQSGTPLAELQVLGGWKTLSMVLRYAHLSGQQLHAAAKRIETSSPLTLPPADNVIALSPYEGEIQEKKATAHSRHTGTNEEKNEGKEKEENRGNLLFFKEK